MVVFQLALLFWSFFAIVGKVCGSADGFVTTSNEEKEIQGDGSATQHHIDPEKQVLLERLERLEKIFNSTHFNVELDDKSLLEVLYDSFKSNMLDSVPLTDKECRFDLYTGECLPRCKCQLRPSVGDYTLDRMCRLREPEQIKDLLDTCSESTTSLLFKARSKLSTFVNDRLLTGIEELKTKALMNVHQQLSRAPHSDEECKWSFRTFSCSPKSVCSFDYQFGDYSLNRACRLRVDFIEHSVNLDNIEHIRRLGMRHNYNKDVYNVDVNKRSVHNADALAHVGDSSLSAQVENKENKAQQQQDNKETLVKAELEFKYDNN